MSNEKIYKFFTLADLPIQFREEVAAGVAAGKIKVSKEEATGLERIWGGDLEWYFANRTHDLKFTQ